MAYIRQAFLDPKIVNVENDEILENEVSLARWIADSTLLLFSIDESCDFQMQFYIPELETIYIPDLYFKNGLKALNYEGSTIIQLKENLLYESEINQTDLYEHLIKEERVNNIIVVYIHSGSEIKERISSNNHVQFEDGSVFINKIKDAINEGKGQVLSEIRKRNKPKTWKDIREDILTKAINDFNRYNSVLFLGAGVSVSAKLPNWNSLLKQLLPNEDIIKESDFDDIFEEMDFSNLVMARYIQKTLKKSELSNVTDKIRSIFYSHAKRKKSKLVSEICRMVIKQKNVRSVITYNYDTLIEDALKKRRRCFSVYRNNRDENNSFPIYHVHGIIFPEVDSNQVEEVVLSEEDYHRIYSEVFDWSNVEQLHALTRCTCYFIGLSMKDPNLRRLLEIAKRDSGTAVRHYVFLERKSFTTDLQKSELDFQIRENLMADLGLNVIWYEGDDNHKELPELLKRFTFTKKRNPHKRQESREMNEY